jgi:hypothetical protein
MFPSYVLSNLFVKGSLKNNPTGFQMKLRNNIDSGTVTGLGPLTVDDKSFSTDKISLKIRDKAIKADQISNATPVPVFVLSEIEFLVEGEQLSPGDHKLGFTIYTLEAGRFQFSISEALTD